LLTLHYKVKNKIELIETKISYLFFTPQNKFNTQKQFENRSSWRGLSTNDYICFLNFY